VSRLKAEGRSGEILCRMGAASISRDCWSYVCSKVQAPAAPRLVFGLFDLSYFNSSVVGTLAPFNLITIFVVEPHCTRHKDLYATLVRGQED
jgi:hypothetical protein